ncbi:hypothetical protein D3C77_229280 [compost metagenome]
MPEQLGRQPARPITLRQAQVGVELTLTPVSRADTATHIHGHRLTVGQGQAHIQTLANTTGLQAKADVIEGHRFALKRLESNLAIQHGDFRHRLHALQQLLRIQRLVIGFRQSVEGPGSAFIFMQAQMQTTHFKVSQAQLPVGEAGPQIRYHLDAIQAQCRGAFADLDVVDHQYRCQTAPASFQAADMHRHAQSLFGLVFDFGAVFGHQRHQLSAKAYIQRHQHRQQGTDSQAPASHRA